MGLSHSGPPELPPSVEDKPINPAEWCKWPISGGEVSVMARYLAHLMASFISRLVRRCVIILDTRQKVEFALAYFVF